MTISSIKLLSNTKQFNHKYFILSHFENTDKVMIAVGFYKLSAWTQMKDTWLEFNKSKNSESEIYIGLGYGESDPDAIQSLYNSIKNKKNHNLVLCTPDAGIFHPKIYIFIKGDIATIIVGSSNMTHHGWSVNDEVSISFTCTIDSTEFKEFNQYFKRLKKKYNSDDLQALINRYKKEKKEFDGEYRRPKFRFKRKKTSIAGIDMPRLYEYYQYYLDSDEYKEPQERDSRYQNAFENLEKIASSQKLSDNQFHKLFGPLVGHKDFRPKLWHSGSIHRKTYATLENKDSFRHLVRTIKSNLSKNVELAFDIAKSELNSMRKSKQISGVGVNILTEILLTYNPSKFANLNDNPIAVLSELGTDFPNPDQFKGEDYMDYINLIDRIRKELKMGSFHEIDSFFNYVYWNFLDD